MASSGLLDKLAKLFAMLGQMPGLLQFAPCGGRADPAEVLAGGAMSRPVSRAGNCHTPFLVAAIVLCMSSMRSKIHGSTATMEDSSIMSRIGNHSDPSTMVMGSVVSSRQARLEAFRGVMIRGMGCRSPTEVFGARRRLSSYDCKVTEEQNDTVVTKPAHPRVKSGSSCSTCRLAVDCCES